MNNEILTFLVVLHSLVKVAWETRQFCRAGGRLAEPLAIP